MVVYIRHADDNDHKTKYKHDPHITQKGIFKAKIIIHELISKYGYPTEIYFSPFRRCIDTMKVMMHELKKIKNAKSKNIKLYCDISLSRYFTKKDKENPSISKQTLSYNIPIYENKKEFHKRVKSHVSDMSKSPNNIWCITHALVYKNIAKRLNVYTNNRIEFLDYFSNMNIPTPIPNNTSDTHDNTQIKKIYKSYQELTSEQLDPENPEYVPMTERFFITKHHKKLK